MNVFKIITILILGLSSLIVSGCATTDGYYIEDANVPVSTNRKIIASVIGKPRTISENGRELTSLYHDQKFEPLEEDKTTSVRYYTKVIILGARRPYEISVEVKKEVLDPETQTFVEAGLVENMTQKRALDIKKLLNKSLESHQLIDGEAPF